MTEPHGVVLKPTTLHEPTPPHADADPSDSADQPDTDGLSSQKKPTEPVAASVSDPFLELKIDSAALAYMYAKTPKQRREARVNLDALKAQRGLTR